MPDEGPHRKTDLDGLKSPGNLKSGPYVEEMERRGSFPECASGSESGRTALVTGVNSGIGFETVLGLCREGFRVILHCRTLEKAEATAKRIADRFHDAVLDVISFDCCALREVDEGARALTDRYDELDVLVNNAGALFRKRTLTNEGFEAHFGVNYMACFLLTNRLLPLLKKAPSARILNTSSVMHKTGRILFDDLQSERYFHWATAYGNSKLALLYFTYELDRRLRGGRVAVNALDPGIVSTNIFLKDGTVMKRFLKPLMDLVLKSPAQGAQTGIYLATSPEVERVSGKYFVKGRKQRSSELSYDVEIARRLWEVTEQLTEESMKACKGS